VKETGESIFKSIKQSNLAESCHLMIMMERTFYCSKSEMSERKKAAQRLKGCGKVTSDKRLPAVTLTLNIRSASN
jgi:hypothetical protein